MYYEINLSASSKKTMIIPKKYIFCIIFLFITVKFHKVVYDNLIAKIKL